MDNRIKDTLLTVLKTLTDRVAILIVLLALAFYALVLQLFDLQIVNGESYQKKEKTTSTKTISVNAPRGEIFDKFGRPLALNELVYTIKIDTSVKPDDAAVVYTRLVELFDKNEEEVVADFPITETRPYKFTYKTDQWQKWWKENMNIPLELDAEDSVEYLREYFGIPKDMDDEKAYRVLSLLSVVYMERFNLNHLTVGFNVGQDTIIELEEHNEDYPGIYVYLDYLRVYPEGGLFSHTVGYIGRADSKDLELYNGFGYTSNDMVGKTGIEKSFELQLKGTSGQTVAEIGTSGRRVGTAGETSPIPGDNVILTIDRDFQEKCSDILVGYLKQILIGKLSGKSSTERAFTDRELLISMIKAGNISTEKIMEAGMGSLSYSVRDYIENNSGSDPESQDYLKDSTDYLCDCIDKRRISAASVVLVMYEQGIITLKDDEITRLQQNRLSTLDLLTRKLEEDEITPQMTNLMPCTGSVVVVDVKDGSVLASVSYPTYDSNELVNRFNNAYYNQLLNDPTTPMVNRPFQEPRPPGSAFKMAVGLAGLEAGVITPQTTIFDRGIFTDAGVPYARCRPSSGVGGYHGHLTVANALRVSCNYFFYETAYRLGNTKQGTKLEGIATLNQMMTALGLGDRTGIEIGELYDSYPDDILKVSSPSLKDYMESLYNPDSSSSSRAWVDGDTVRTAIGQSYNNYTCANMAKYIATLATKGERYQLHMLDKIESSGGETLVTSSPNLELLLDLKPDNINAILEGMRQVTSSPGGTAYSVFANFPITVGGKTGTAEQSAEFDHTTFGGFAPFDDPQIAVFVIIPYGDTKTLSASAARVARDIIGEYFGINSEPEHTGLNNSLVK